MRGSFLIGLLVWGVGDADFAEGAEERKIIF